MTRILVVEDDTDVRALIARRLTAAGHQVIAVDSAESAIDTVDARGLPDLAVLDVGLPGMSGIDLAVALRSREGATTLPVVFLSADVLPHHVEAGRAIGATYLTKPFVANALLAKVTEALQHHVPPGW